MHDKSIKILFLADTHLGFDLPTKPRIKRRRRGIDFFKNYKLALQPAFDKKIDLLIHGGDIFYRSRIPDLLVNMAFEPLLKIADNGIPIVIVPGNHERSKIRLTLFEQHHNIFIFTCPNTFQFNLKNIKINLSGFPCIRYNIRDSFAKIVAQTGWSESIADIRILCMHQAVEGAQVGVQNYTFRQHVDTIRGRDIPGGFAAILSGHIHRHQVLTSELNHKSLKTNVYYPGSIERTAFAERNEEKGYLILECLPGKKGGTVKKWNFCQLLARPMIDLQINVHGRNKTELMRKIKAETENLNENGILRITFVGDESSINDSLPATEDIRNICPPTMNVMTKIKVF